MSRRVAAIDCGTNSIRLLVADVDTSGGVPTLRDVERTMQVVRLGQGVDSTGSLDPEAIERTLTAARAYAVSLREHGASAVRFVATSASRDASNAADFVSGIRAVFAEELGWDVAPEVISGAEEAGLSFTGATGDLVAQGIPGPYLVVDIGGGSTEFVRGTDGVDAARSVDIGCVRLTERHLAGDPPTPEQVEAALRDVDAAIDTAFAEVEPASVRALVGLAGSVTTITAHALGLAAYDSARIHLTAMSPQATTEACTSLLGMTREQRLALGFMHPGRADVIGAGALVWRRIVERTCAVAPVESVVTSEHDILDGIALSLA